jgi:hypothetical protein
MARYFRCRLLCSNSIIYFILKKEIYYIWLVDREEAAVVVAVDAIN